MSPVGSLSVFLPVYNEAAVLEDTVRRAVAALGRLGVAEFEVIIVDDGSRDGSAAIADKLAADIPGVRVVHHQVNGGYGAALQSGFEAATKDWVFYTDGDGQFELADLVHFWPLVDQYDVLLGYRISRQDHLGRKLNAAVWSLLVRLILRLSVRDPDCAFKLIRRSVLQEVMPLQSTGAVISPELLVKLQAKGHRFAQIGVTHYPRRAGQPSGASIRVIMRALRELVWLRRQMKRAGRAS